MTLMNHPPHDRWHDWTELDAKAWPRKVERNYTIVPTTCFNCEAACGLTAFVDNETGKIAKFEGNPEHPASRGRNCAKGPATLNQVDDPERILYPLKRVGARGGGGWERISWDQALDEIGARIRLALQEQRTNEVMYHVGRPGEDGYTERVLKAWGVDGHNSHTNICSSNARIGYQSWMGHDRPSSDFANAEVIFLISAHLEAGHYFNPHAQRIMEGKAKGATVICVDPRLSNTGAKADYWLAPWPGTEPFMLLAMARLLIVNGTWEREFVRRWVNWETYLRETRPDLPCVFESLESALLDAYADYTPERAAHICGIEADTIVEIAEDHRRPPHQARQPQLARRRRRQPRRMAGGALPVLPQRAHRIGGDQGRHLWQRMEQDGAAASVRRATDHDLERAELASGIPARLPRDVDPAPPLPQRGPRQARHLLQPGLQPDLDQPRRLLVDGGAARRDEGGMPRGAHTDLVRDVVARRLRAPDGARLGTPRPGQLRDACRSLDRLPSTRDAALRRTQR